MNFEELKHRFQALLFNMSLDLCPKCRSGKIQAVEAVPPASLSETLSACWTIECQDCRFRSDDRYFASKEEAAKHWNEVET